MLKPSKTLTFVTKGMEIVRKIKVKHTNKLITYIEHKKMENKSHKIQATINTYSTYSNSSLIHKSQA